VALSKTISALPGAPFLAKWAKNAKKQQLATENKDRGCMRIYRRKQRERRGKKTCGKKILNAEKDEDPQ
jgi:hypothetical protein